MTTYIQQQFKEVRYLCPSEFTAHSGQMRLKIAGPVQDSNYINISSGQLDIIEQVLQASPQNILKNSGAISLTLSTITGRPVLMYGQAHVVADKAEDSDFDCMYFGKDVAEILVKVKSDFNERITLEGFGGTANDALESLETLYYLNQAKTEIEMRAWFKNYYAYYDFSIFSQEL